MKGWPVFPFSKEGRKKKGGRRRSGKRGTASSFLLPSFVGFSCHVSNDVFSVPRKRAEGGKELSVLYAFVSHF